MIRVANTREQSGKLSGNNASSAEATLVANIEFSDLIIKNCMGRPIQFNVMPVALEEQVLIRQTQILKLQLRHSMKTFSFRRFRLDSKVARKVDFEHPREKSFTQASLLAESKIVN